MHGPVARASPPPIDAVEEAGEELVAGAYHLEVSSPGIDRPLTRPKDFANWAGHEVKIALTEKVGDHRKLRGRLLGIENGEVVVEDRKFGRIAAPLDIVHSAKLVLTDELIAATKPLDMSGADEFEETPDEEKVED